MDAKMLRDKYANDLFLPLPLEQLEEIRLKIRALDLLAAVDGSQDEIVRELRDEADLCRNETATDIADLIDEAASCIVAMASQFKAMKARAEKAEAELVELKRHAEAMHYAFEGCPLEIQCAVFDAYRAVRRAPI